VSTDDSNTINLKLFPTRPPPPPILAHQVPLLTISLASLQSPISSDLTLNRILPYINGVNSISRVAQLADTDLSLTRRAIQHLVYYGCLVLLDVFSFGAIYAPTAEISGFIIDEDIKDECMRYVRVPRLRIGSEARTVRGESESEPIRNESTSSSTSETTPSTLRTSSLDTSTTPNDDNTNPTNEWRIDPITLIQLYTSLRQGLTLKNWVLQNLPLLHGIDIRRLITFGIIKGFLYRVHKYAITTTSALPPAPPTSLATSTANLRESETATLRGTGMGVQHPTFSLHRPSVQHPSTSQPKQDGGGVVQHDVLGDKGAHENTLPLLKFLDGMHCFDEICTELGLEEKVVEDKVRGMGEGLGVIVQR
jgi:hypothetical protein